MNAEPMKLDSSALSPEELEEKLAEIRDQFGLAKVEKVRIEETMMNSFEYAGGLELGPAVPKRALG